MRGCIARRVPCSTRSASTTIRGPSLVELGVAQQQMVEIAKALSQRARILVMDEPTAALSERETNALFALIRQLRACGVAIVYISHRLQEVFEIGRPGDGAARRTPRGHVARGRGDARPADRHDGRTRGGRGVQAPAVRHSGQGRAGSARARRPRPACTMWISIVREGEIVGLSGLVGAGRTEVARAVFGADAVVAGEVRIFGAVAEGGPERVAARGVALIPENRKLRRPGAQALGSGQSAGREPVEALSARLVSRGAGVSARARADRPAARDPARAATAGARALGRQSAEGSHRQMAGRRVPAVPVRRADARHRRRRQERDLRADRGPGGTRRRRPADQLRALRDRSRLRPRLRHARRQNRRRACPSATFGGEHSPAWRCTRRKTDARLSFLAFGRAACTRRCRRSFRSACCWWRARFSQCTASPPRAISPISVCKPRSC